MHFIFADRVDDVLNAALCEEGASVASGLTSPDEPGEC